MKANVKRTRDGRESAQAVAPTGDGMGSATATKTQDYTRGAERSTWQPLLSYTPGAVMTGNMP